MSTDDDKKDAGFKVRDRRAASQEASSEPAEAPEPSPAPDTERKPQGLPKIDFTTFVASLTTSAMLHLGVIADPDTKQAKPNLPLAQQTIDILGMLQDKTKGNLDESEATVLQRLLYDLRMRYLEASKLG